MTPKRTADTMSEAIALSSPSGHMSKRARLASEKRLSLALFGPAGLQQPKCPQPSEKKRLLHRAKYLRDIAERGMSVRAFTREANKIEAQAAELD